MPDAAEVAKIAGVRRAILGFGLGLLAMLPAAPAAATPLGLDRCAPARGVYQCSGLVATWDGIPLDTTVILPRPRARHLPLVVELPGFANSKYEYLDPHSTAYTDNVFAWAEDGYAVLTFTSRGMWGSCGTPEARLASPVACLRGYNHFADARYEVRDAQELIGRLVDEGVADPSAIGVTGDSGGGGPTIMLAALRNRVMLPDGRLRRWRSPRGTPLRIAAAAPVIPWTDLVYAAAPNGRTLSYAIGPPGAEFTPVGVEKATFVNAIFLAAQFAVGPGQPVGEPFVAGRPMGFLAPPGLDPEADVTQWVARTSAGEPYTDPLARSIVKTLVRYHSAYYIEPDRPPAPLLIASGFTDDLFPADEALRFANRTARRFPHAPLRLLFGDFGHQRAQNKPRDRARLLSAIHRWLDHFLRGRGSIAEHGVTATTQSCPRDAPSQGPFRASSFTRLARGEVRYSAGAPRSVDSIGADPLIGAEIDPVTGGGDPCVTTPTAVQPGTATYLLPPARGRGYTLLGAPTISARLELTGAAGVPQLAGRLWDVGPGGGSQTLIARGFYRPSADGRAVWQLHPNGWRFAPGHRPKLELLGSDPPFGRPSNGLFSVGVSKLALRLPVRERPDCRTILRVAKPLLPPGSRLAPGGWNGRPPRCPQ